MTAGALFFWVGDAVKMDGETYVFYSYFKLNTQKLVYFLIVFFFNPAWKKKIEKTFRKFLARMSDKSVQKVSEICYKEESFHLYDKLEM